MDRISGYWARVDLYSIYHVDFIVILAQKKQIKGASDKVLRSRERGREGGQRKKRTPHASVTDLYFLTYTRSHPALAHHPLQHTTQVATRGNDVLAWTFFIFFHFPKTDTVSIL
jgi:hypothetical protein